MTATSENINELAAALAKAQGEIKNATLNKVNPHFKSKYADLAAIRDAVMAGLSKNGLSVTQCFSHNDGGLTLFTRLMHTSGQWIESAYPLPLATDKPQVVGSAITYGRRYSLAAIIGIASDEDDDGNAAQSTPAKKDSRSIDWHGPLNKTALNARARELWRVIDGCTESEQLIALWESAKATREQMMVDTPDWYDNDGEPGGLKQKFMARRDELTEKPA